MAAYGSSCTNVALLDPLTGSSNICSGFPTIANGCSGPFTIGQNTTGGSGPSNGVTGTNPGGTCSGFPSLGILETSNFNFGKHFVGTNDYFRTFTLKNSGSGTCPAILGNLGIGSSPDFEIGTAGSCSSGTSLAANASCTIQIKMKSVSAGGKSGTLQVPFTYGGNSQTPVNFTLSSNIIEDVVIFPSGMVFQPAPLSTSEWKWSFDQPAGQCTLASSTNSVFFKALTISSGVDIKFSVNLTGVSPASTSITYYGPQSSCIPNLSTNCWTNPYFPYVSSTSELTVGSTPVNVYFKNTSGLDQSGVNPSRATANLSYRPSDSPADAPKKVRQLAMATWCY